MRVAADSGKDVAQKLAERGSVVTPCGLGQDDPRLADRPALFLLLDPPHLIEGDPGLFGGAETLHDLDRGLDDAPALVALITNRSQHQGSAAGIGAGVVFQVFKEPGNRLAKLGASYAPVMVGVHKFEEDGVNVDAHDRSARSNPVGFIQFAHTT